MTVQSKGWKKHSSWSETNFAHSQTICMPPAMFVVKSSTSACYLEKFVSTSAAEGGHACFKLKFFIGKMHRISKNQIFEIFKSTVNMQLFIFHKAKHFEISSQTSSLQNVVLLWALANSYSLYLALKIPIFMGRVYNFLGVLFPCILAWETPAQFSTISRENIKIFVESGNFAVRTSSDCCWLNFRVLLNRTLT